MCHLPSVVNDPSSQIYAPLNVSVTRFTKAIASFYWDDSETGFRGLLTIYIPILYLPTFSESNAWDFHLVMTEISGNVPATSEDFRQISEDFRSLPKIKCPLTVPEDVWALSKLLKVARYSFSGSIPPKFKRKLRRHKQSFGKTATTVVLDKDENLLWSGLQRHRSCHSNEMTLLPILLAAVYLGTGNCSSKIIDGSFFLQ